LFNCAVNVYESLTIGFKKWLENKLFFIKLNNSFFKNINFNNFCTNLKRALFATIYPKLWEDELTWDILPKRLM